MKINTIHDYVNEYNKIIADAMAQAWDEAAEYYGVGQADVREGKQDNPYRRAAA